MTPLPVPRGRIPTGGYPVKLLLLALFAALATTVVTACSSDPEVRFRTRAVDGFTPDEDAAATFRALVAGSNETPQCEDVREAPGAVGVRTLSLTYSGPQQRRIEVLLDADGEPLHYTDSRGNADSSPEEDYTSIVIDFGSDRAMALNRLANGGGVQATPMTVEDALQAESLGNPQLMIDRILEECPAPTD